MTYYEQLLHEQVDVLQDDVKDLYQRIRELEGIVESLQKPYETTQNQAILQPSKRKQRGLKNAKQLPSEAKNW